MSSRRSHGLALAGTLGGLLVALALIGLSDGFYHDDDVMHYCFALDGWSDAEAALHWWARPGYTLPAMIAARAGGFVGCRLLSAIMTAAVAWLAYGIARHLTRGDERLARCAWLAPLLVWAQPLVAILAETTLTETPAALYLTLGIWLWLQRWRVAASAVLSLLFVTRLETAAFLPLFALVLLIEAWRERGSRAFAPWLWFSVPLLAWAPLAWWLACELLGVPRGSGPFGAIEREPSGDYGHGTWLHFIQQWLLACGIGVIALFLAGIWRLGRRGFAIGGLVLGLVLLHTVLFRFNRVDSGGYGRFLVPAAGLLAAVAAAGIGSLGASRGARALAWMVLGLGAWSATEIVRVLGWPQALHVALIVLAVACCAAGLAAAAVPRSARLSVWVLGIVVVAQAGALVRPLVLRPPVEVIERAGEIQLEERLPILFVQPLAMDALQYGAVLDELLGRLPPERSKGLWCSHVAARLLVPDARKVHGRAHGIEVWDSAPPGALFVWDAKYGGGEDSALRRSLQAGGRRLAAVRFGPALVELYERRGRVE